VTAQAPGRTVMANPLSGWRDRLIGLRNRMIGNPSFQRWAAASPLTRFIARRQARALFDLCAGFVYSQVLAAFVELRLCDHLADGPRTVETLARLTDLTPQAAVRLLRAGASLGLVRPLPDERYALDDLGASMIGNPSIAAFIAHHALLYDDLRDPVALLRGQTQTKLSQFWPYAGDRPQPSVSDEAPAAQPAAYGDYSALMARSQALVAQDILDAWPMTRHRRLLDVGGGEGVFIAEAAARAPDLQLQLFDLPPVAARAEAALARRGLSRRVDCIAGSFLRDPLPRGADIISLVRIVHDHDEESALALLRAVHDALPSGGTLLIAEPMAGTPGAEPIGDAYFGFYLLAMGRGRARRPDELKQLLNAVGFTRIRTLATRRPLLAGAMVAKKL